MPYYKSQSLRVRLSMRFAILSSPPVLEPPREVSLQLLVPVGLPPLRRHPLPQRPPLHPVKSLTALGSEGLLHSLGKPDEVRMNY